MPLNCKTMMYSYMRNFHLISKYCLAAAASEAQKKQVKYNYSDQISKRTGSFTHARGAKNLQKTYHLRSVP